MRLSEIKGERVFDVIADIIEPACNIASDPVASRMFRGEKAPEGMEPKDFALQKAKEVIPHLMRTHRDDLVAILAAIEGKDPKEYVSELTMPALIKGVYEMMTDDDLLGFLS